MNCKKIGKPQGGQVKDEWLYENEYYFASFIRIRSIMAGGQSAKNGQVKTVSNLQRRP